MQACGTRKKPACIDSTSEGRSVSFRGHRGSRATSIPTIWLIVRSSTEAGVPIADQPKYTTPNWVSLFFCSGANVGSSSQLEKEVVGAYLELAWTLEEEKLLRDRLEVWRRRISESRTTLDPEVFVRRMRQ